MSRGTIRVVVIDDQALVRAGLVALLQTADGIEIVGEAGDGRDGVRLVHELAPDVALIDLRMPVMDGIETIRRIRSDTRCGATRLLVLTTFGLDDDVFGALHEGADGYLLKDTPPEHLLDAIRVVAAGGSLLSPAVLERLVDETRSSRSNPAQTLPDLTDREADVLALVCEGLTNRQIADRLIIGSATVKSYVSRLLMKFEVESRVALVIAARGDGLGRRTATTESRQL